MTKRWAWRWRGREAGRERGTHTERYGGRGGVNGAGVGGEERGWWGEGGREREKTGT